VLAGAVVVVAEGIAARTTGAELRSATLIGGEAAGMKVNAALSYARHGIPVFPVHWIEGGKCSCHKPGCGSPGKHPLIVGWQAEATADSAVIKAWWGRYPNANIGVLTGKRSNVTVADIDGDVGKNTLRDLELKNGELPDTPRVITGSGGYHYYFQHEPRTD
jgi:putative DNA primase/helicase